MRTGRIEANLVNLNEEFKLKYLDGLTTQKLEGPEKGSLKDDDTQFHQQEVGRLRRELDEAFQNSTLPERPSCRPALNDLLIRLRKLTTALE